MKQCPKLGAWLEAQFLMAHGWKLSHFRSSWHNSLLWVVGEAPQVEQVLRLPPPIEEGGCLWGWDLLVLVPDLPLRRLQRREIRVMVVLLAGGERRQNLCLLLRHPNALALVVAAGGSPLVGPGSGGVASGWELLDGDGRCPPSEVLSRCCLRQPDARVHHALVPGLREGTDLDGIVHRAQRHRVLEDVPSLPRSASHVSATVGAGVLPEMTDGWVCVACLHDLSEAGIGAGSFPKGDVPVVRFREPLFEMKHELSGSHGCERNEAAGPCGVLQALAASRVPGEPEEVARAGSGRFRHDLDQVRNVRGRGCELFALRLLAPFVKGDRRRNRWVWGCLVCSWLGFGWALEENSVARELAAFPRILNLLDCLRRAQPLLQVGWELGLGSLRHGPAMRLLQAPVLLGDEEERVWRMPLIRAVRQKVVLSSG